MFDRNTPFAKINKETCHFYKVWKMQLSVPQDVYGYHAWDTSSAQLFLKHVLENMSAYSLSSQLGYGIFAEVLKTRFRCYAKCTPSQAAKSPRVDKRGCSQIHNERLLKCGSL